MDFSIEPGLLLSADHYWGRGRSLGPIGYPDRHMLTKWYQEYFLERPEKSVFAAKSERSFMRFPDDMVTAGFTVCRETKASSYLKKMSYTHLAVMAGTGQREYTERDSS